MSAEMLKRLAGTEERNSSTLVVWRAEMEADEGVG
jgi:hypothetical protein